MQQYLPFTVLKRHNEWIHYYLRLGVATVLTVYGIETKDILIRIAEKALQQYLPFTVLKLQYPNIQRR